MKSDREERLAYVANVKDGWYDGDGKQVTKRAVETARNFIEATGTDPGIFPTLEGGITLQWRKSHRTVTIEISPNEPSDSDQDEVWIFNFEK